MTRRDFGKPAFSLRKKTLRENTCAIASGDYSTPVSQRLRVRGHQACLKGYTVRYYRLPRLILALTQAKADGSYSKLLKAIAGLDLLIIDDWGLEPLNASTRNDLMEIMDDRYEQSATLIISQLPTE